jgi:hypothetical protein
MKNVFLSFSLFVLVLCSSVQKVEAQIEDIYFPYHNYMNYYLPETLSDLGYFALTSGSYLKDNVQNDRYTYVSPYNFASPARVDSCKIYGLAACISDIVYPYGNNFDYERALYAYNEGLLNDAELEAVVFEGTEGDTIVRMVKSQVFSVRHGQYPDKGLHLSDTGGVRVGVYEFYFDTPVTVKGTFFVGLRYNGKHAQSVDDIRLYAIRMVGRNMPDYNAPVYGQCAPGYYSVDCKYDSLIWNWAALCESWWASSGTVYPATIPDVEEMELVIDLHPGFFPIIKPKNNAVVEAAEEVYGVEVVPNPTRGRAAVHSKRAIRSVAVSDMGGHEMMRKTFGGEQYIADLPEFPKGCYVVTVETVQGIAVKKLVVE